MKKYLLPAFVLLFLSSPALSADEAGLAEIKQMAQGSGEDLKLYGLYPGMTKAEAIEVAKKADTIRVLNEDPNNKGGILYENESPRIKVTILFHRPEEGPVTNETVRAYKIDIKRLSDVRGQRIKAQDLIEEVKEVLGEPTDFSDKGKSYHLGYRKSDLELSDIVAACTKEATDISHQDRAKLRSQVSEEVINIYKTNCPNAFEDYKTFRASSLGPSLSVQFKDGSSEAYIIMSYQADSYKPKLK